MADISQLRLSTISHGLNGDLSSKEWSGIDADAKLYRVYIWTDGENVYFSNDGSKEHYVLNKETSTWEEKTWNGLANPSSNIWTDGENVYLSQGTKQYVLDKATSTWSEKTWNGLSNFYAGSVWTDGENIYHSSENKQYVLNKATSTWSEKTWNGLSNIIGSNVWTDGENIYYSYGSSQYVLNKDTSTWSEKTWNGLSDFNASGRIWTDGENIYYSARSSHYVLNKATSTWEAKTWSYTNFMGSSVWTDGENIYTSEGVNQHMFDVSDVEVFETYDLKDTVARQNDASLDSRVTALEQGGGGSGGGSSVLPVRCGNNLQVVNTLPTPSSTYKDRTYFFVGASSGTTQNKQAYRCVTDDGGNTYEWRLEKISLRDTSGIQEVSSLPDPTSTNLWDVKYNGKYYSRVYNYSASTYEWVECIIEYYYLPDVESHMGLGNYPAYNAGATASYPNGISISYLSGTMAKISFKRKLTANGTTKLLTNINNYLSSHPGSYQRAVGYVSCSKGDKLYPLNIYNSTTEYIQLYTGGTTTDEDGLYVAVDEAGFYSSSIYSPDSKGNILIYVDLYVGI